MRRFAGLLLTGMVLLAGCADKDKVPSDVLARDKMEKVLWDMMQADQYAATYIAKDTLVATPAGTARKDSAAAAAKKGGGATEPAAISKQPDTAKQRDTAKHITPVDLKMETLKLYQQVFTVNKVTREEFARSYRYYQERPDLIRGIFDSLLAKGNRLRTESYSRPSAPTPNANPGSPAPIPPTTINPIKTNVPGGLIKDRAIHRPPVFPNAPASKPAGAATDKPTSPPKP